jgi:hypothetical protein
MEVAATLLGAAKVLGQLASTLVGKQKELAEIAKARLELANDLMGASRRERDRLKERVAELEEENKKLHERLAFRELVDEFHPGPDGVLYWKFPDGSFHEAPYCPVDKVPMVPQTVRNVACPNCGFAAKS